MKLFDQALEERIAVGFVFDRDVRGFGNELECADFVTHNARCLFSACRNEQARGREPNLYGAHARIASDDHWHGTHKAERLTPDAITDLLVDHGMFETPADIVQAVRRLRALRVRRENVLELADRADREKRAPAQAERERQFARTA